MTRNVLTELSTLIRDHYVFPDVAERIVAALPGVQPGGTAEEQGAELTAAVQSVNHDRHLRVRPHHDGSAAADADQEEARAAARATRTAGGILTVRRLEVASGNHLPGLLEIAPAMAPVHLAEPYVRAAFALLAGVDALVIDLRAGLGGTPETVALICGHLLGAEPVHLQDMAGRDGSVRQQYWSMPAYGRLADGVPIAVLTSERTFSGCEELAYDLQALGRARLFGRTTGGGAHPIERFALDDRLEVTVPVERSVNAVTGTNWEQVGVRPDVDCDTDTALDAALEWVAS